MVFNKYYIFIVVFYLFYTICDLINTDWISEMVQWNCVKQLSYTEVSAQVGIILEKIKLESNYNWYYMQRKRTQVFPSLLNPTLAIYLINSIQNIK